jgi:hypothetical protein
MHLITDGKKPPGKTWNWSFIAKEIVNQLPEWNHIGQAHLFHVQLILNQSIVISTNNIAIAMVRGSQVRFQFTKSMLSYTHPAPPASLLSCHVSDVVLKLLVECPCVAMGYQVLYLVYLYIIYVNITGFCWMYDQIFFYAHLSPSASSISGISLSYRNMVFTTAI